MLFSFCLVVVFEDRLIMGEGCWRVVGLGLCIALWVWSAGGYFDCSRGMDRCCEVGNLKYAWRVRGV